MGSKLKIIMIAMLLLSFAGCSGSLRTVQSGGTLGAQVEDTDAPIVLYRSPGVGATAIALNASIMVIFNEAMNASTINTSTMVVSGSDPIERVVTYDEAMQAAVCSLCTVVRPPS